MDWPWFLYILSKLLASLTAICFAYQLAYLVLPLFQKKPAGTPDTLHRYGILIAARNEARVLPHLLESIQRQSYPQERLRVYVVADNCTDQTAAVARALGAQVLIRTSKTRVGKGYALQDLVAYIQRNGDLESLDAFLIFDADNLLDPNYIRNINGLCAQGYQAFCGYRNTKNFQSSWLSAAYGVWYLHDSAHLNSSRMALGSCCMVNGTGFGFTRSLLEQMGGWPFVSLTEDIAFSYWCAAQGIRIGYCPDAVLYDEQPLTFHQSWRQRIRWVQGGLQLLGKPTAALLRGIRQTGMAGYSCFEFTTLSVPGCFLGILSALSAGAYAVLSGGGPGLLRLLIYGLAGSYCSFFLVGLLTVLQEWRRIPAKPRWKLFGVITFPLYILSYIPIAVAAPFCKFQWTPVEHTVALRPQDLPVVFASGPAKDRVS